MPASTLLTFYSAFQNRDWRTMQSCYHDQAVFSDPVFQNLSAKEAKAMWHMLSEANTSIDISYRDIKADGQKGSCHWEARYIFSRSGRSVHNVIEGEFEFKDEKIFRHNDHFNLWRWAGMALGLPGKLLGWTPFMQNKIRKMARTGLSKFIATHPEYQ